MHLISGGNIIAVFKPNEYANKGLTKKSNNGF